jgi:hypothetical protein
MGGIVNAKDLRHWNELEDEIDQLEAKYGADRLLFRGVGDSSWTLATTLERAGCQNTPFSEYCRLIAFNIKPALETFTGHEWNVPEMSTETLAPGEPFFLDRELLSLHKFPSQPLYSYLIYLRHHGFPSPLLDWSSSPFVAAFFAFRNRNTAARRSVYVYCELPKGFKGGAVGAPTIRRIGPYVRAHPRHFRQQSDYTICGAYDPNYGWRFHPHESVFGGRGEQDLIWEYTLPSEERTKVLGVLNYHNLNAYSLFDSEESLLETLWFKEHDLKQARQI